VHEIETCMSSRVLLQEDHKKRAKQLEVAFDKNDELEKKINQ